ncbi:myo-inositol-1-phosphate synthase [halophilic archaeon]|nr:myo-inositol-1-phosphate synthase [halophilic archaeon]
MTTGVWFVGARGNIATTAMVGATAIERGEMDATGMVTEREPCADLELPSVDEFVFGGHDLVSGNVPETARGLAERNRMLDDDTVESVADDLADVDDHVRTGTALNCGSAVDELADWRPLEADHTVAEIVDGLREDLREFRETTGADRVVVVNVASTEPAVDDPSRYDDLAGFEDAVESDDRDLPASSLYAYAAIAEGHPYVNFTPNAGSALGGVRELAEREDVPHMGNDGKTGESLLKSALAPMFAQRNLRVQSWEGHNILGNTDGRVLEDERNREGKIESKGGILDGILDEEFHEGVHIDYTPSLADQKTAWDYIHFEGFLGTEMKLQFTWEGSDSALAAPLVLDLVRLAAHADEHDEGGLQPQLASFFKSPLGVDEHGLSRQFDALREYVERHAERRTPAATD